MAGLSWGSPGLMLASERPGLAIGRRGRLEVVLARNICAKENATNVQRPPPAGAICSAAPNPAAAARAHRFACAQSRIRARQHPGQLLRDPGGSRRAGGDRNRDLQ
ncbi:Hypothetical predicted protein [Marmota monax]|uniref:Uncharacterized protein n=1 Tax=Marmota monax TaxID=9995 RepID=A0A5E4AMY5_MARMO|nr:Hypothetical predicted protein [Marmota monax]